MRNVLLATITEYFYSKNTAMKVELSRNGLFVEIANTTGKNEAGNTTFGWRGKEVENSEVLKISRKEALHFSHLIKVFFEKGEAEFKKESKRLCGKENYELFHNNKLKKSNKIISFSPYKSLLYLKISASKERKISFPISYPESFLIRNFIEFAVSKSYEIETAKEILKKEKSNGKS